MVSKGRPRVRANDRTYTSCRSSFKRPRWSFTPPDPSAAAAAAAACFSSRAVFAVRESAYKRLVRCINVSTTSSEVLGGQSTRPRMYDRVTLTETDECIRSKVALTDLVAIICHKFLGKFVEVCECQLSRIVALCNSQKDHACRVDVTCRIWRRTNEIVQRVARPAVDGACRCRGRRDSSKK